MPFQLALGKHNLAILNLDAPNIVGQLQPISLFHQPLLQRIIDQRHRNVQVSNLELGRIKRRIAVS